MTRESALEVLSEALRRVEELHGSAAVETVASLVSVGELRVAAEILCDNLAELDVRLSRELHARLLEALDVARVSPEERAVIPPPAR